MRVDWLGRRAAPIWISNMPAHLAAAVLEFSLLCTDGHAQLKDAQTPEATPGAAPPAISRFVIRNWLRVATR